MCLKKQESGLNFSISPSRHPTAGLQSWCFFKYSSFTRQWTAQLDHQNPYDRQQETVAVITVTRDGPYKILKKLIVKGRLFWSDGLWAQP